MTPQEGFILAELCERFLRPVDLADLANPRFDPPLTTAEQATFADLQTMSRLGLQTLTLADFQARKADVVLLRQFLGIASPTQAQAVAALKALIRVTGAMLRLDLTA